MRVHWLQHVAHEDLGCIAPWLAARGAQVSCTAIHAGEAPPPIADFDWLIVMGGPMNIDEHDAHPWLVAEKQLIRQALDAGKRLLGICLGAQLIADQLGGPVTRNAHTEIGWWPVQLTPEGRACDLFADFTDKFLPFHWHGDTYALPPGATCLALSEGCAQQAFEFDGGRVLGLQFHPEVTAADARRWLLGETLEAARYVQTGPQILEDLGRFASANRLMVSLLDRMASRG